MDAMEQVEMRKLQKSKEASENLLHNTTTYFLIV